MALLSDAGVCCPSCLGAILLRGFTLAQAPPQMEAWLIPSPWHSGATLCPGEGSGSRQGLQSLVGPSPEKWIQLCSSPWLVQVTGHLSNVSG